MTNTTVPFRFAGALRRCHADPSASAPSAAAPGDGATLAQACSLYIQVRRCWEALSGAATVFISDAQLERAKHIIQRIELALTRRSPALDKAALWKAATEDAGWSPDIRFCKARHGFLIEQFRKLLPEENVTPKDF